MSGLESIKHAAEGYMDRITRLQARLLQEQEEEVPPTSVAEVHQKIVDLERSQYDNLLFVARWVVGIIKHLGTVSSEVSNKHE